MNADLFDYGNVPEIFADGVGDVKFIGEHARIVLFSWRPVSGVLRRCATVEIIRPVRTLAPPVIPYWQQKFESEARH